MVIYPTMRHLEMFSTVARLRSFSRASEALNMSQSALSQAIAQMELLLAVPLFERTKRSVTITTAGEIFLLRSRQIMADFEAAITELKRGNDPQFGNVSIACLSTVAARILPAFVSIFRARYPGVRVRVYDDHPDGITARVKAGSVDMAFSCMFEHDAEVRFIPLIEDLLRVVCRKDHPLCALPVVTWDDLERFDVIALAAGSGIRTLIDRLLPKSRLFRDATYEVARVPSVLEIVEGSHSVSVIPALALASKQANKKFHHRAIDGPEIKREMGLIVRRSQALPAAAQAFQDMLIAHLGSYHAEPYPGVRILRPPTP
jgi:LysR family carnitine catabolism transcriptional activator